MEIVRIVVDTVSCLFEILLAIFFFSAFGERRFSKKIMAVLLAGIWLAYAVLLTVVGNGNGIFFISMGLTFLAALCYRFKLRNAVFASVSISIIAILSELFMAMLLTLSGIDVQTTQNDIYMYIAGIILSKSLTCLFVAIVHKGRHKLFRSAKGERFWGIFLLPMASILIILIFINFFSQYNAGTIWKVMSMVALLLLVITNVTIFYIIDRQYELINTKQNLRMSNVLLENQRQYYDTIFESQQEIRKMRHDLKHIFMAVLSKMDNGDLEAARLIVQSRLEETAKFIDFNNLRTDTMMGSVVHSKTQIAKAQSVELEAELKAQHNLPIEDLDLAVLLSNLLDNAIEAAAQVDELPRKVNLSVFTHDGNLVIVVANPFKGEIDVDNMRTSKPDKKNHGFGLLSVKSIVEKYHGDYTVECKEGRFQTTTFFYGNE